MHLIKGGSSREKGAITVFLALIFMSLIVFAGAVIDIVRIAAADRKVQSVLNSSARSVLAGYDKELAGEYGIFGINTSTEAIREDFYRYLRVNLAERHKGISFTNITVEADDIKIEGMESLLKEEAFKKQVQEYMKYRTPVIATFELIEHLKNIKLDKKVDFAQSEKITRDKARELRTKAHEVNSRLAGIKKKMADLGAEKLEDLSSDLSETLTVTGTIFDSSGKSLLDGYDDSREAANIKAKAGECIENQSEEFESVMDNSESLASELNDCLAEVNKTIDAVKPMLRNLKELKEELEDLKEELSDLRDSENSTKESIEEIMDEIDEVRTDINEVEGRIDEKMSRLKTKLGGFSPEGYTLKDESVELSNHNMQEIKKSIGQIKDNIAGALIKSLEKDWLISAEEFENGNMIISRDFALMDEEVRYSTSMQEEQAEKSNNVILESIEKLSEAVEAAASGTAEKINIIEYIMDKFTFLTSKTERNHYFRKGEVEYIISGADTGEAYDRLRNTEYYVITNVFFQVWALRFAIDAIDNFIRSAVVFPPQRLTFALAEGALDSSLDMLNMLKGEGVPLCPESFTSVRLKYSDHLRLLLLMKPEEEILRKTRQLMQVNINQVLDAKTGAISRDFRMRDYNTVISASVTARVNLLFLPLLKVDSLMPGSFEDGRFMINKQIYVGY